ncbi:uncharacterized protein LOC112511264 [Cynara cardunculus var. scolymus]|uniref:uncharacterized protein LOC112511264 n=1 Tax=Cynara cardunculus var. scolymus TaxID=59895 RepID=UPI000D62B38F|nr:uncharacterized protein LOC112511264 [Cynara cardunculus var. scolymus]
MDSKDVDMMDSDAPVTSSPSDTTELSSVSDQIEVARRLLTVARQLIDQGKPSQALQAVLTAMRAKGGEAAAFQALTRAKELYRNKIHETTAADELASLFAECAIAEASPEPSTSNNTISHPFPSFESDTSGTSILAETGRKQIVLDAFSDGSSFVCLQCGGLVSNDRRDEHYAFWCGRS